MTTKHKIGIIIEPHDHAYGHQVMVDCRYCRDTNRCGCDNIDDCGMVKSMRKKIDTITTRENPIGWLSGIDRYVDIAPASKAEFDRICRTVRQTVARYFRTGENNR